MQIKYGINVLLIKNTSLPGMLKNKRQINNIACFRMWNWNLVSHLSEKRLLKPYKNWVLIIMRRPKGQEGLRAEYISIKIRTLQIILRMKRSRGACILGRGVEQKSLVCQTSSKRITLRGQSFAWEGNIKMDLKRLEW
jgi:hypothetical protein